MCCFYAWHFLSFSVTSIHGFLLVLLPLPSVCNGLVRWFSCQIKYIYVYVYNVNNGSIRQKIYVRQIYVNRWIRNENKNFFYFYCERLTNGSENEKNQKNLHKNQICHFLFISLIIFGWHWLINGFWLIFALYFCHITSGWSFDIK